MTSAPRPEAAALAAALTGLTALLGERLALGQAVRDHHGKDVTHHPGQSPDAVAFVRSREEVQEVLRICHAHRIPVIPYGTGSSLEGHITAPFGGVTLNMAAMDRILSVHAEDLDAVVEPGVTREALNQHLRDTGLFFPIDPGANASLGGMAATRASGTNAVRYGTMAENVRALEVVLPDGSLIHTGSRARKSSSGYDLTHLFVGSEGTLGVVTALTLRLHGIPESTAAAVCAFDSVEEAVQTTIQTIQIGIPVARIEFLDAQAVEAVNRHSKLGLPVKPTLFLEFHGSNAALAEQTEMVAALAKANGGGDFKWATRAEERSALWAARHQALFAAKGLRPGCEVVISDVCVPISCMAEAIAAVRRDIDAQGLLAPIIGHVGDGNFHVLFLIDPADVAEIAKVEAVNARMVEQALTLGGTATGEHGIGLGKKRYLRKEHGAAVDLMAALKRAVDPTGIMNPGKIFD